MPTLFDSHEEFNEWFSKDIESHAENKSAIDESEYSKGYSFFPPILYVCFLAYLKIGVPTLSFYPGSICMWYDL